MEPNNQADEPVNPYQCVTIPGEKVDGAALAPPRTGKRVGIIAVCTIAGSVTSIIVGLALVYVASSWPLDQLIRLGGGFDFFLIPAVILSGGFFGAVASFLLAVAYKQPTERAVWVMTFILPGLVAIEFLRSGKIADVAILLILVSGVLAGMYVSKALCRLLGYPPMQMRQPTSPVK